MRITAALTTLTVALATGAALSAGAPGAAPPCETATVAVNGRVTGGPGPDCIVGGPGNDRLAGLAGPDTLDGASGNDTVTGGGGADVLSGGPGLDTLSGGAGGDVLSDVPENYEAGSLAPVRNRFRGGAGQDRVSSANGRPDTVHCGPGRDRVTADRSDRLAGCEQKRFLRSPLPEAAPGSGGRQKTFMVRFRAVEEIAASQGELYSITIAGPAGRGCGKIVTNSLGVRYRPGATVRYRVDPFGPGGKAAERWCRGLYRGKVDFLRVPAGCPVTMSASPPPCAPAVRIGRFSFRVR